MTADPFRILLPPSIDIPVVICTVKYTHTHMDRMNGIVAQHIKQKPSESGDTVSVWEAHANTLSLKKKKEDKCVLELATPPHVLQ